MGAIFCEFSAAAAATSSGAGVVGGSSGLKQDKGVGQTGRAATAAAATRRERARRSFCLFKLLIWMQNDVERVIHDQETCSR